MSETWVTILGLCAGTVVMKAAGPVVAGGRPLPARVAGVFALLAPALLTALVIVQTLGGPERGIHVDARVAGLGAAAVAIALRLPLVVVVVTAAVVAALVRAVA